MVIVYQLNRQQRDSSPTPLPLFEEVNLNREQESPFIEPSNFVFIPPTYEKLLSTRPQSLSVIHHGFMGDWGLMNKQGWSILSPEWYLKRRTLPFCGSPCWSSNHQQQEQRRSIWNQSVFLRATYDRIAEWTHIHIGWRTWTAEP